MKKSHLKKARNKIIEIRIKIYLNTIYILLMNFIYDMKTAFSKIFDLIKLFIIFIYEVLSIISLIVFFPILIVLYVSYNIVKDKKQFEKYYQDGFIPKLKTVSKRLLKPHEKHIRYSIENGFIFEFYKNNRDAIQRQTVLNASSIVGKITKGTIKRSYVYYLIKIMESKGELVLQKESNLGKTTIGGSKWKRKLSDISI